MVKKYYYSILLVFQLSVISLSAQTNTYTSITSPATLTGGTTDEFTVSNSSGFATGDKVLLIQMQGADIVTSDDANYGNISSINNAGNYEFAEICQISGNTITLTTSLLRDYAISGNVQMVSVPQYINHTINSTLNASQSWNGSTGGVLVFEVSGTLTLNADIDVSGQGFRGGEISDNNTFCVGGFLPTATASITNYVTSSTNLAAGKGESIATTNPDRGRGKLASGGGGGNTFEAGGGGGGNGGSGGLGGYGKDSGFSFGFCTGVDNTSFNPDKRGIGGLDLSSQFASDKIFFGGGGGGGQATNGSLGFPASTAGGNGGGIVIIVADEIIGNSFKVSANGQTALDAFDTTAGVDGVGGGGAGGVILLDVNTYTAALEVEAIGGNGGNTTSGDGHDYGTGGGGGGGLIWVSGTDLPSAVTNLTISVNAGLEGKSNGADYGADDGSIGVELANLSIPQNTTFTSLSGTFTVGGASPDFVDFETAVSEINSKGIHGNVILNIRNGTYTESSNDAHTFDNYRNCTKTLTIQSESGNIADVTLSTNSTTSTGLGLKNIDNVIVQNLTIQNTQGVITSQTDFYEAFLADNATATINNVKIIGNTSINNSSNITLTGNNEIENGNLNIAANLTNNSTLTVGSGTDGGNIKFNSASANFTNTGSNIINLQGKDWIETVVGGTFTPNTGTVNFNSTTTAQEIQGGTNTNTFYNLTINNSNGVTLNNNHALDNLLTLSDGLLQTGSNTLFFNSIYPEANNPSETSSSRIIGNAQMNTKTVGTGTLNFLGVNLTGSDDIGDVIILRTTGTNGIQTLPSNNSIACTWDIQVTQQPATSRDISFSWLSDLDNGNSPIGSQIWKNSTGTWNIVGSPLNASGNPRVMPFTTINTFSEWTINSTNTALSIAEIKLKAKRIENQTIFLSWEVAELIQEQITHFILEKSYDGITYFPINNINAVYQYQDIEEQDAFYRVKGFSSENSTKFISNIVYLQNIGSSIFLKIYPNPIIEKINITSNIDSKQVFTATLSNVKGKLLSKYNGKLNRFEYWLHKQFDTITKGVFMLDINVNNQHIIQRIMKQ